MLTTLLLVLVAATAGDQPQPTVEVGRRKDSLAVGFTATPLDSPASGAVATRSQATIDPRSVLRFTVQWRVAQPDPDQPPDFGPYDEQIVEPALDRGLRPLVVVMAAPEWAWGDGDCNEGIARARGYCVMPPGEDDESIARWSEFVSAVARHYGKEAAGIEIWNEQNAGGFWNDSDGPSADHYTRLLCTGYRAAKAASPKTTVIAGGLAAERDEDGPVAPGEFLGQMYESGVDKIERCMDAVAIHPYPHQLAPDDPAGGFLTTLDEVRSTLDAAGDARRPIWITEFGYHTEGLGGVTEAEQASWLACATRMSAAMPDVQAFVIHTLVDRDPAVDPVEGSFGIYGTPSASGVIAPKPAAIALRRLLGGGGSIRPAAGC